MKLLSKYVVIPAVVLTYMACSHDIDIQPQPTVLQLHSVEEIHGLTPQILGNPSVTEIDGVKGIRFNGVDDGIILPINPVEGLDVFTVQVLFYPDSDGPREQRFVHFQDTLMNRILIETRVNTDHTWYFDTFLYHHEPNSRLTLIDSENVHQTDRWYWGAITYDGRNMKHFINGVEELAGNVDFGPMVTGEMSIGVRLNRVHWFKGIISEIRIDSTVLTSNELEKYDHLETIGYLNIAGTAFDAL